MERLQQSACTDKQLGCLQRLTTLERGAEKTKSLDLKWNFAVISPRIVRIEDGGLVFPTKLSRHAHVKLIPENPRQQALLEQAANEHWQVGQSIVTPEWCAVPFTRYMDLASEKDRVINELLLAKAH